MCTHGPAVSLCAAASNLTNARALSGRVAVVRRGGCEFVDKAARVQQAGAIAMVIINYEDQDVKAGSAEGGVADTITIPVVTVRRTIGAPLFAHAAQVADAFEHDQASSPSQYKKLRGVEVSLAFGAARYTQTATPSPQSVQVAETVLSKQQPPSEYWEAVEASWRREGGWRGDPGLRGRQVVVSSTRLRRTARAARTIGVVNGAASAMDWEDNWPALAAQAEMLLTRHRMFTFAGYSHHYGGFWRFEDDPTDRSVSYPYTEAGLQAVAPLWLASILFCEVPPVDPTAGASTVPGSTCESEDSLETDDGSTSGEFAVGGVADEDRDKSPSSDTDKPAAGPGPVSYDSSPFLNLNCSNAIAASRTSALLRSVRSGMLGAASSLKLQYVIIDVMVVRNLLPDTCPRLILEHLCDANCVTPMDVVGCCGLHGQVRLNHSAFSVKCVYMNSSICLSVQSHPAAPDVEYTLRTCVLRHMQCAAACRFALLHYPRVNPDRVVCLHADRAARRLVTRIVACARHITTDATYWWRGDPAAGVAELLCRKFGARILDSTRSIQSVEHVSCTLASLCPCGGG